TPITPPGVKVSVLTSAGASQNPNTGGGEPTEMSRRAGKKIQEGPEQTLVPSRVEEQTVTMTRDEMQRMIAEAVAAQLKQVQPEQPRVEPLRIEQPNIEREQQAQSNERQNRRAEEEASSIRTVNPQARDETLEQLLPQVRDLQARVEGRKTSGSRGHPFSQHILDADLPQGFHDLNISYDGSTDPSRHMRSFENMAVLHRYNDPVQCRAFLTTLRGSAQDWFHQLPAGAIKDFEGFSSSFLNQFASVRPQEKSFLTLMGIQQKEGESLRDYVARYARACVEVPRASEEIKAGGLTRGLLPGLCRNSLAKRPGRTFDEVLGRCAKYMNVEEAEADFSQASKTIKIDPRDERKKKRVSSTGERKGSPRAEREGRPRGWRPTHYIPLMAPQARILEVMEREIRDHVVRWPKTRNDGPTRPKSNPYYELRGQLVELLREFRDIFAFPPEELTGIDPEVMEHKLNVDPLKKTVKQRLRHHGAEIDKAIEVEVDKLLKAKHIKEIQFPEWISNTVMVKKALSKWRMCIDFRDLNLACPKDHYPLPRIDQLVDSTAGCELLSMMDASLGYHQIPLAPEDQSKVSFVTSKGTYCYVVMPFGLKNAGATYQRLMDRMFRSQIGRNMEVYVDDILVKSRSSTSHVEDLKEAFKTLRTYGMKLNPSKCAFGVRAGRFLGYIVTEKGIEVNKDKVKAILDMAPPKNVRELQVLTGRIAGLSRFIARAVERSFPFFKLLKKKAFQWNDEAQMAFEKLKEFLSELPLLTKPEPGDELVLYISVGIFSLSSVLLREAEGAQQPIYYTSRVLQGAEARYSEVEKAALTLVITARKLRPYFLNHAIIVRTNFQLGETLGRPIVSGRLVKWAVDLSEYSIKYEPRRAIKAQALADFIQEGTKGASKKWIMHVDGSSAARGS
ncbi:Uncharacterized mitochondrial protein AtMg00860, partial [Striga hermonthica]